MSYLLSPAWFALLAVWAVMGVSAEQNVIRYFTGENPQVSWPEMSHVNNVFILLFMYGMLLAPKFLGATAIGRTGLSLRDLGGPLQFAFSFVTEIVVSILYAPILMVQQTLAVARTYIGITEKWVPQARDGGRYGFWAVMKFHALETLMGAALVFGMWEGFITVWLAPIAVSLLGAVPLSMLSGVKLTAHRWTARQMGTAEVFNAPAIIRAAKRERRQLQEILDADRIAAE
jgi:membrane glycosyltransferase